MRRTRWLPSSRQPVLAAALLAFAFGCSDGDNDGSPGGDGGTDPTGDGGTNPGRDGGPGPGDDAGGEPEGVRAFPGAQGFGALVTGGRGGQVIKVTTLASSGPGSLQAALNVSGPRIIVFDVSGVIEADIIEIPYGDVTIAGQTAPGAGITIAGRLFAEYDEDVTNIIVRHIRVRPEYDGSAGEQFDALQFSRNSQFILDHMSISFGVDETVDLYEAKDATVQWSVIESSGTEGHPEGSHNYGLINGPDGARVSVHHTLFAHHKARAPAIANGPSEVINNVMYNVRHGFVHHNPATGPFNMIGNYFKDGSDDTLIPFYFDSEDGFDADDLGYYIADSYYDNPDGDCDGAIDNPWQDCDMELEAPESLRQTSTYDFSSAGDFYAPVSVSPVANAYDAVLARAGAWPRDVVTLASVSDTEDREGSWGANYPDDLLAGLTPGTPPTDADNDGMADAWELANGLDPEDGDDHSTITATGYTAIEDYINHLAADLLP